VNLRRRQRVWAKRPEPGGPAPPQDVRRSMMEPDGMDAVMCTLKILSSHNRAHLTEAGRSEQRPVVGRTSPAPPPPRVVVEPATGWRISGARSGATKQSQSQRSSARSRSISKPDPVGIVPEKDSGGRGNSRAGVRTPRQGGPTLGR